MRRVLAPLLVGLGVFLLALAVLIPTVLMPRVEKAPLDQYTVTRAAGTGTYLNPQTLDFVSQDDVTITRVIRGDVEASGDDVATYDSTQTVEPAQMDEPLNVVTERVVFDRRTGEGTGGRGDRPSHEDAYAIKFPFDVQRRDYDFHDLTAADAYPVSFQRETEVDGLTVYEFRGEVPETQRGQLGVPGELVGAPDESTVFVEEYYENRGRVLLVEPRTGIVVGGSSAPRRLWRPAAIEDAGTDTVIFEAEVSTTEESTAGLVADARDAKSQLDLYGRTLPLVLGILGLVSLVAGLLLLARSRRERAAHAVEYQY